MKTLTPSELLRKGPCEACGSSDANAYYSDGHTHCFSCSTTVQGDGPTTATPRRPVSFTPLDGEAVGLPPRKITQDTTKKFGYLVGKDARENPVQIAPYYDSDGNLVAQKVRTKNKDFTIVGSVRDAMPFGAHLWQKSGKKIVVTEGEIDALTMSQVQGNKYPVVSLINGASSAKKFFAQHKDYFRNFDEVVLMFDMDAPGRAAAEEGARILGSRARIASLPDGCKDPNDMLVAGRVQELVDAVWRAIPFRPEGMLTLDDIADKVKQTPTVGLSWPWPGLTALTYGIQKPYIYTIGAATGAGKTDFLHQLIQHLTLVHQVPVGAFLLEEEPHTTGMRVASKVAGRILHTPEGWSEEAFDEAWTKMKAGGKLHLYDSFGSNEWEPVKDKIEYLHETEGVEHFIIDHLTAFAASAEDERKALESIMSEMSSLVTKLGVTIFLVSHLATPEGKPHEEGGRVMIRHFKGARAIGFWSHGAIGIERDQQAEDPVARSTSIYRVLKVRGFGWNVGKVMHVRFDPATGLLTESGPPDEGGGMAENFGFTSTHDTGASSDGGPSDF